MRSALLTVAVVVLLAAASCTEPTEPTEEFHQTYVLGRVAVDPISAFGRNMNVNEEHWLELDEFFEMASCEGQPLIGVNAPFVLTFDGIRQGDRAIGEAAAYVGWPTEDLRCDGTDEFYVIEETAFCIDESGESVCRGPVYIEGQMGDARIDFRGLDPEFARFLQGWAQITFELHRGTWQVNRGRLITTWGASFLHMRPVPNYAPATRLDFAVVGGMQPDVDEDGDGLERFYDTDGDLMIDRCVDGDGTVIDEGSHDCPLNPEFADGFEFVMILSALPATLIWAEE